MYSTKVDTEQISCDVSENFRILLIANCVGPRFAIAWDKTNCSKHFIFHFTMNLFTNVPDETGSGLSATLANWPPSVGDGGGSWT